MWYRVFGTNQTEPAPSALLVHLQELGWNVTARFSGDDQGWFRAEIVSPAGEPVLHLERYLVSEDGIRAELNNWAAWIETNEGNPHQSRLMQHMISTTQLFTLQPAPHGADQRWETLCGFLAQKTAGVYQVDGQGFFDADGTLLIRE